MGDLFFGKVMLGCSVLNSTECRRDALWSSWEIGFEAVRSRRPASSLQCSLKNQVGVMNPAGRLLPSESSFPCSLDLFLLIPVIETGIYSDASDGSFNLLGTPL